MQFLTWVNFELCSQSNCRLQKNERNGINRQGGTSMAQPPEGPWRALGKKREASEAALPGSAATGTRSPVPFGSELTYYGLGTKWRLFSKVAQPPPTLHLALVNPEEGLRHEKR